MARTVFAEVSEAQPLVAPIVENVAPRVESMSFFDTPALEPEPISSQAVSYEVDYQEEIEIVVDESPSLPSRPQTADGTFGDDLDIPEFLRG